MMKCQKPCHLSDWMYCSMNGTPYLVYTESMKTILISGGSHGLGKALAAHYAKDNTVVILSSNKEKLQNTAQEIGCEYEVCDVSNWESVHTAVQNILSKHNHIDVLINNAGLSS